MAAEEPPPQAALAELREAFAALRPDTFAEIAARFAGYIDYEESGAAVASRAAAALDAGVGASFVRLGDGEGVVVAVALRRHPALTDFAARQVGERHLGDPEALLAADPDLFERYRASVANADVVGVPNPGVVALLPTMIAPRSAFGLLSVYELLDEIAGSGRAANLLTNASFNTPLLDHLPQLLAGRDVVLVTCHVRLQAAIADRFDARSVSLLTVPAQASLRWEQGPTGHFPGRYRELLVELAELAPGSLVLVAAGVLSEVYCEVVRAAGSVAVDVGSSVDVLAGRRTRVWGQTDEIMEAHRLL